MQTSGPVPRPVFLGFPAPAREAMAPAGFVPRKDSGGIKGFVGKMVTATGTEVNSDAIDLDMDG